MRNPFRKAVRPEPRIARWWSFVTKGDGVRDCWSWRGGKDEDGYGRFKFSNKLTRAHRVACELRWGPAAMVGKLACHTCDNPGCVNPDHLYPGTHADNRRDCVARGRTAKGERNGHHTKPWATARGATHHWHCRPETRGIGERNGRARMSDLGAMEVLRRLAAGERACDLAAELGVTPTTIYLLRTGRSWKHIPRNTENTHE